MCKNVSESLGSATVLTDQLPLILQLFSIYSLFYQERWCISQHSPGVNLIPVSRESEVRA